ncbi:glycosyltransferase [Hahella sp. KA22]|uniref:glycosyltransferase family 2 protein n=1 Tax=Hahella sp. KA22 TaxID=1628392 RepID=UPI000FDDBE83|nr:glycosyltransferase family A protein [Hahella sp. KA22]AZZ91404.1 glycosyltransferase family 2 protein [Hahella sp. KA22]QAY54774.1 glycosyltransferase [Hahella sp. KA22]
MTTANSDMTTEAPLVSVIMPVYNREKTVAQAIESVLAQSFTDFELIVVDDGSTDRSAEVVKGFSQDVRVRYHLQENSGRPSLARNSGLKLARGQWVAFLDSDDRWTPTKLERQIALLEQCAAQGVSLDLVISDYEVMESEVVKHSSFFKAYSVNKRLAGAVEQSFPDGWTYRQRPFLQALYGLGFAATQAVLVRRSLLERVGGFDSELVFAEDNDLWMTISEQGRVGCSKGIAYTYVHHGDNITSVKSDRFYTDTINVLFKHLATARKLGVPMEPLKERYANYYLSLCRNRLREQRWKEAASAFYSGLPGLTSKRNWKMTARIGITALQSLTTKRARRSAQLS